MSEINVVSKQNIGTVEKQPESIPGTWVKFYKDITGEEQEALTNTKDEKEGGYQMVITMVQDWNFADDKGKLDISIASLKRLPLKLQTWLAKTALEVLSEGIEVKKKLPES